jgi:hypothetical protein
MPGVRVQPSYRSRVRNMPRLTRMRCPCTACQGTLTLSFTHDASVPIHGHVGGSLPLYRCDACNVRFSILNPHSFGPPCPSN